MVFGYLDTNAAAIYLEKTMDCRYKNIRSLEGIGYFKKLGSLDASQNPISLLPAMPASLAYLFLNGCRIKQLPKTLPPKLLWLCIDENGLTKLPVLPQGLITLLIGSNAISELPELPVTLEDLSCYFNRIKVLPPLPKGIKKLHCNFNDIAVIPILPDTMQHLYWANNPAQCLSNVPALVEHYDKIPVKCKP